MILFMIELRVADFATSLSWYRDILGWTVERLDEPHQFALLRGSGGGRLALKAGVPAPEGVRLHLQTDRLQEELTRLAGHGVQPDGPITESMEGYRRATLRDPDGYRLILFEWTSLQIGPV